MANSATTIVSESFQPNTQMCLKQTSKSLIAVLFVVSLLVRLLALASFPPPDLDPSAEIAYLGGAQILVNGKGFSDPSYPVYAPPFYTIFIATIFSLFGDGQVYVKIVQAFLDSLMIVVAYYIIREIFDARTGLLSAAILAIYPFSTYLTISIASEPLFAFLLSIFVLLTICAVRSQKFYYYCAAGILLGLATLTRGTTQFLPLIFPMMLLPFHRLTKDFLLAYIAFCLSFTLVILPWSLRNYIVLEDFIPVGTAGGGVFLEGSSEKFFTIDGKTSELPPYLETLRVRGLAVPPEGSKPSQAEKFLTRAGIENYKSRLQNDPLSFFPFLLNKFFRLWYATESGHNHRVILAINLLIYPFALAGLILAWVRKKSLAWLLFCIVLYFVLIHCVSVPLFRYMVPIMPYVIGFAAFAIIMIIERLGLGIPRKLQEVYLLVAK